MNVMYLTYDDAEGNLKVFHSLDKAIKFLADYEAKTFEEVDLEDFYYDRTGLNWRGKKENLSKWLKNYIIKNNGNVDYVCSIETIEIGDEEE